MLGETNKLILADVRSSGRLWGFDVSDGRGISVPDDAPLDEGADWSWAHYALGDQRSRLFIERLQLLPQAVRHCLLGHEPRVQLHVEGDWSYGVLPDFVHEMEGDATSACLLSFGFDGRHLITTRRRALHVIDRVRREVEHGASLPRPADAIALHVARFIDATEQTLVALSGQLDHAEDQVLSERGDLENLRVGPIRRDLSARHREFTALRSAFNRALSHRSGTNAGGLSIHLPRLLQEIDDFDRDLSGLHDRAKLVHDELEARRAEVANRSLRVLTILSTLLLPPTVIVGAFGMNLRGIPFGEQGAGFWSATIVCVIAVVFCYYALKRARIL